MDYLKKIGTAVLLAVAAMAIMGAGSAAAEQSVFCKVNETPCASGNQYPKGTEVVLKSKGAITWTTYVEKEKIKSFSCLGAEFKGETTATGGSTETVGVTFHTQLLSSCTCPFETIRNAKMKFNWVSGTMNATVTSEGPDYRFVCSGPIFGTHHCTFEGDFQEGITLTGGNPAILAFKEAPVQQVTGGLPCGTEARLNVEFEVSTPKPLYVSNA
jgi:hypothetical protein